MADVGPLIAHASDPNPTPINVTLGPAARSTEDRGGNQRQFTSTNQGTVSGVVKELGVAIGGKIIRVYDRYTGEFLGWTVSAGDGTWSLSGLGRSKVYIVAFDSPYNALVLDNVTPG